MSHSTSSGHGFGEGQEQLITAPTFGPRCALCWERFKVGDTYRSIWPKRPAGGGRRPPLSLLPEAAPSVVRRPPPAVDLGISVHPACGAQLDDGDLTRIFAAIERQLALPIAVLNGRRVEVWGSGVGLCGAAAPQSRESEALA